MDDEAVQRFVTHVLSKNSRLLIRRLHFNIRAGGADLDNESYDHLVGFD